MMVMSSQCLDQPVQLSKLFLKKAPQLWAKTSPGSSMGVDPPRQKLAPQHGRDTCTFNGAKLPPRATHSTQDGEGCLCNFLFRLSLDAKLTECYWYVCSTQRTAIDIPTQNSASILGRSKSCHICLLPQPTADLAPAHLSNFEDKMSMLRIPQ